MHEHSWLLYGTYLGDQPSKSSLISADHAPSKRTKKPYWLHLHLDYPETKQWLEKESGLDPIAVDALLAEETRPRVSDISNGVIIILRGINLNENEEPEDMISIRIFTDGHRIISTRRRKMKPVSDIVQLIETGSAPHTSGELLTKLIALLCKHMAPTIDHINDVVDDIEEKFLEDPNSAIRQDLLDIRRQAIILKRYLSPMRQALADLKFSDYEWLSTYNKHQIHENYDHITRFVEDLDAIRERLQITYDEIRNIISDRLNKTMYLISVITAIFLPLGFLTGLLGVNLSGIPGANNPSSFMVFAGILVGILSLQAFIFKVLRWF